MPDPLLQQSTGLLDGALAHERRGSRALGAGRHAEAAAAFRAGLVLAPEDPASDQAWMGRGVALIQLATARRIASGGAC